MWRSLVLPVLQKQVGIFRTSSGSCTSRFVHITGSGDDIDSKEDAKLYKNEKKKIYCSGSPIFIANHVLVAVLTEEPDRDSLYEAKSCNLIQSLLRYSKDRHLQSTRQKDLTICLPKTEQDEKHSGFGFSNMFLGVEKWWYGIVVVSSIISWHRLFLKDPTYYINKSYPDVLQPHILPVNGPAKPVDPLDTAISLFENAVADCTAVTQNALGIKFFTLNLHEKAVTYFKSASDKGNTAAHFNLGLCYEKGIGTTKDISKAVSSYAFAAFRGHPEAGYNLGGIYLEGKHVCKKTNEGLKWMEMAASKGSIKAQRFLGLYYADDTNEHYSIKTSLKWLQVAADQNDMVAQYHLGICYERGFGVARNMRKAAELYGEAAKNGHPGAQYNYGVFLEQGLGGLSVDKHEAIRWYKMASDGGNNNAKHNITCLQKELSDLERVKEKSSLLKRLLSDVWYSKKSTTQTGMLPRCASSPDRLYTTAESDESHITPKHEIQQKTFEDNKCVWVI